MYTQCGRNSRPLSTVEMAQTREMTYFQVRAARLNKPFQQMILLTASLLSLDNAHLAIICGVYSHFELKHSSKKRHYAHMVESDGP